MAQQSITLQTSDADVVSGDVLGRVNFAASNESSGSEAKWIGASIYAEASGEFTATVNPTNLVFATSDADGVTARYKVTNVGHLIPNVTSTYNIGSSALKINNIFSATGTLDRVATTGIQLTGSASQSGLLYINNSNLISSSPNVLFSNADLASPKLIFKASGTTTPDLSLNILTTASGTTSGVQTLSIQGSAGELFSITDVLDSGTIFSVNDISGLSLIEADASGVVTLVRYGTNVAVGDFVPTQKLHVGGNLRVSGAYYDSLNSPGTSGQVLVSTAVGTDWKTLSEIVGVDGVGISGYTARWIDAETISSGIIYDNGTNIGIGTASPSYKLDVVGNVRATNYVYGDVAVLTPLILNTTATDLTINNASATQNLLLWTSGVERFRITSIGRVGINSNAPTAQLHINTNNATTTGVIVRGAASQSADLQQWQNSAGTALVRVDAAGSISGVASGIFMGRVGIGITNPAFGLESSGNAAIRDTLYVGPSTSQIGIIGLDTSSRGQMGANAQTIEPNNGASNLRILTPLTGGAGTISIGYWKAGLAQQWNRALSISNSPTVPHLMLQPDVGGTMIGTATDINARLGVRGSGNSLSSTDVFKVQNADGSGIFTIRDDGNTVYGPTTGLNGAVISASDGSDNTSFSAMCGLRFRSSLGATTNGADHFFRNYQGSRTYTAGAGRLMEINGAFAPVGGTSTYETLNVVGTINQTGGANGAVRGIYVNQTLTSVSDYRAIEANNNTGWAFFAQGTASSHFNGNVGIGTTSVAAGPRLFVVNSSAAVTGVIVRGAASQTADLLQIQNSAGTTLLDIDAAGSLSGVGSGIFMQRVGVGTSIPSTRFQAGELAGHYLTEANTDAGVIIGYASAARIQLSRNAYSSYGASYAPTNGDAGLKIGNGSEYAYVIGGTSGNLLLNPVAGKVSIGTINPAELFTVYGSNQNIQLQSATNAGSNAIIFADTAARFEIYRPASSSDLRFKSRDGGVGDVMTLTYSTANVGIGTTSPTQRLHVSGNMRLTGAFFDSLNVPGASGQVLVSTSGGVEWRTSSGGTIDGTGSANYLARWIDADTLGTGIVYDNGTNVGVRTTAPSTTLDVRGTGYFSESVRTSGTVVFASGNTGTVGVMQWNDGEGTVQLGLKGGNVNVELAQDNVVLCYNGVGSSLSKGQVVYASGAQGQRPSVNLALATSDLSSARTIGLVDETIGVGAEGFVVTFGVVTNLNTSALTAGSGLWLSATTPGAITMTRPVAPNHGVFLGWCLNSHASAGRIFVNVQNGAEIEELHDVLIQNVASGDVLQYDSSNLTWRNRTRSQAGLVEGVGVSGYVPRWTGTNLISSGLIYDNNTNVGVGTSSPSYRLHIVGGSMYLDHNHVFYTSDIRGTSGLNLNTGTSANVFIANGGGNVGVGTTSPTAKLHVVGSGQFTAGIYTNNIEMPYIMAAGRNLTNDLNLYALDAVDSYLSVTDTEANGSGVIIVGDKAGVFASGVRSTVAIGNVALASGTNAPWSVFIGRRAGYTSESLGASVAIGASAFSNAKQAIPGNDIGFSVAVGYAAGANARLSGRGSTFIGASAGQNTVDSYYNTFVGINAGYYSSGLYNTVGIGPAAFGNVSASYTDGTINSEYSVGIGPSAGSASKGFNNSIVIGKTAGAYASGNNNIYFGVNCGLRASGSYNFELLNSGTSLLGYTTSSNKLHINRLIAGDFETKKVAIGNITSANLSPDATLEVLPKTTTDVGVIIQGVAAQTADLFQVQNSAGTALVRVDAAGSVSGVASGLFNYIGLNNPAKSATRFDILETGVKNSVSYISLIRDASTVDNIAANSIGYSYIPQNLNHNYSGVFTGFRYDNVANCSGQIGLYNNLGYSRYNYGTLTSIENVAVTGYGSYVDFVNDANAATLSKAVGYGMNWTGDNGAWSNNPNIIGVELNINDVLNEYATIYGLKADIAVGMNSVGYGFYITGGDFSYLQHSLGLGRTIPSAKLDLVTNSNNEIGIITRGSAAQTADLQQWLNSASGVLLRVDAAGSISGVASGIFMQRIGVATSDPTQTLHVAGNARLTGALFDSLNLPGTSGQFLVSTSGGIEWRTGGGGGVTGTGAANKLAFFDSTTNITSDTNLHWDNTNKRLGVGQVSPVTVLDVLRSGTITTSQTGVRIINNSTSSTNSISKEGLFVASSGTFSGSSTTNRGLSVRSYNGATVEGINILAQTAASTLYGIQSVLTINSTETNIYGYHTTASNSINTQNKTYYGYNFQLSDDETTATTVNSYGVRSYQDFTDNTSAGSKYGIYSYIKNASNSNSAVYGLYSDVNLPASPINNSYGCFIIGGGAGGRLSYGVYTTGTNNNYFDSRVGINQISPTAMLQVQPTGATVTGVIVRGAGGQTADLLQIQTSVSNPIFKVASNGSVLVDLSPAAVTTATGIIVRGAANQTADLQQWQNSLGTALVRVDAVGSISGVASGIFDQNLRVANIPSGTTETDIVLVKTDGTFVKRPSSSLGVGGGSGISNEDSIINALIFG